MHVVIVWFLYELVEKEPSGLRVKWTSKKASEQEASNSFVKLIELLMVLKVY